MNEQDREVVAEARNYLDGLLLGGQKRKVLIFLNAMTSCAIEGNRLADQHRKTLDEMLSGRNVNAHDAKELIDLMKELIPDENS